MGGKALEGEFALLANLPSEQNDRKSDSCAAGKGSEGTVVPGADSYAAHVPCLRALVFCVMSPGSRKGGRAFRVGFALRVKQRGLKKICVQQQGLTCGIGLPTLSTFQALAL